MLRTAHRSRLPHRRWWRRALAARHPSDGPALCGALRAEYRHLLAEAPPWMTADPVLRLHLRQSIGPQLAAYRVLTAHGTEPATARAEVADLVAAQMRPFLVLLGLTDRLRPPFGALRRLNRRLVPRVFPAPGFTVAWRRNDDRPSASTSPGAST